jgi:UDP-glucose 4-epimerase
LKNPNELYVHGGKEQQKTYLDVHDCIDAMLMITEKANDRINIYNLGNSETIGLPDSIPIITKHMGLNPEIIWSGNEVGWIGDSKINNLDTTKLQALGWKPNYNIQQTIERTLHWLDKNRWILSLRGEI